MGPGCRVSGNQRENMTTTMTGTYSPGVRGGGTPLFLHLCYMRICRHKGSGLYADHVMCHVVKAKEDTKFYSQEKFHAVSRISYIFQINFKRMQALNCL